MRKPVPSPGGTGSFHIFVFLLIIFPHFASSNVTVILVPLPGLLIDSNNLLGTVTHLYTLFFNLYIRFLFSPIGSILSIFESITRVLSALSPIIFAISLALANSV